MRRLVPWCLALVAIACCGDAAGAADDSGWPADMWVRVPTGATALGDVGIYRVTYQRYGQDLVVMPSAWTGHFTLDAGIAFCPVVHDGKPALLLHCPWRGGTGAVWVDYPLELPKVTPAAFAVGIAMRRDIAGTSDGVTFSVHLGAGGRMKELVREHYTSGDVKELKFDLSPYAGQRVVLRIQTEPGPKNSSSYDFSRFVDPRIIVGSQMGSRARTVADMTGTKAYQAARKVGLAKLNNRSDRGVVSSCKMPHKNSVAKAGSSYHLAYQGDDCRIVYEYTPKTGSLDDVVCRVDSTKPFQVCSGGGVFLGDASGMAPPERATLRKAGVTGDRLQVVWEYASANTSATVNWTFRVVGKALVIEASSPDMTVGRFSVGRVGATDFRKNIPVPCLYYESAYYLPAQRAFVFSYIDWTQSHSSECPGTEARYLKKLDGKRNALHEVGYVAVSPDLDEVLPNMPNPASPYLKLLGPRMVLDIWGGMYEDDARMLEHYKSYGIDQVAIIKHVWQRYGYDVKLPDHLPADERFGGDDAMALLGATAKRLGYVFSLHENYIDFYPDAPSYTPKHVALDPKGKFWRAWYHKGTKVQSWGLKSNWAVHYAKQNSPEIHRRFSTTAAYLDVHTCVQPWRYCDFDPTQEMAGMGACRLLHHQRLFQFMRDTHEGPLFGEGSRHFFWAGWVDGVEAQVDGGEECPVLVNFDLLKLHPQMVNHGMGYYTRWLRTRRETKWGVDAPTPVQLDKYRAQELAYGHASFMGSQLWRVLPLAVREYNICQPVQALYGGAKVDEILYEVEGQFVTSSVAAVAGVLDRLRVRYDSGLTLHVNLREADWRVGDAVLPQYGFIAQGPDTLVYTAKRDGVIADFARTPDSLYVDARTELVAPWAYGQKQIEPRLKSLKYLGGRKLEIAYEWDINDVLEDDCHCFVHFQNAGAKTSSEGIIFQNDHRVPRPTSKWRPGMLLSDGPYTVAVPPDCPVDRLDILIGLFKGARVKLEGVSAGSQRIVIGRLLITRQNGKIADIRLGDIDDLKQGQAGLRRRFTDRLNVGRKKIDFGPAATDGSFKVLLKRDRLELLPYPRDRKFSIELDLAAIVPGKRVTSAEVVGMDAEGKPVGRMTLKVAQGRLSFAAGMPGVVRYEIKF